METQDWFFNRSADLVMQSKGFILHEEIAKLSDADILRIPGVGRKALNALRELYPYDHMPPEPEVTDKIQERRLRAIHSLPLIELGSFYNVTGARIVNGNLLIKIKGHRELFSVQLRRSGNVEGQGLQEGDGFGLIPEDVLFRLGFSFPELHGVHSVNFTDFKNYDDSWGSKIQIMTYQATFQITVSGEQEAPDDRATECGDNRPPSFIEEVKQEPDMAELYSKLEKVWHRIDRDLKAGAPINALKALSSAYIEIEKLMRFAMERAKLRGITIIDETFGLTETDHPDLNYDINDDQIFEWAEFFPSFEGPISVIGQALNILLKGKSPIDLTEAKDCLQRLGSLPLSELPTVMSRFEAVVAEIEDYHTALKAAGEAGILQKKTIAYVDGRFTDDGGMARRAIKRWIVARIADGDMVALKTAHGKLVRLSKLALSPLPLPTVVEGL